MEDAAPATSPETNPYASRKSTYYALGLLTVVVALPRTMKGRVQLPKGQGRQADRLVPTVVIGRQRVFRLYMALSVACFVAYLVWPKLQKGFLKIIPPPLVVVIVGRSRAQRRQGERRVSASQDAATVRSSLMFYVSLMKSHNALSPARREMLAAVVSNVNDCYY